MDETPLGGALPLLPHTFMSCEGTALYLFVQHRTLIHDLLASDQKVGRTIVLTMQNTETTRQAMNVQRNTVALLRTIHTPSTIRTAWYRIIRRDCCHDDLLSPATINRT
jgi:hypothetical protein